MGERRPFTITCVREQLEGPLGRYFTAHVSCAGETLHVDDLHGSWIATLRDGSRRHVLPHIAAELQRRCYTAAQRRVALRVSRSDASPGVPVPPSRENGRTRLPAQLDMNGRAHDIAPVHERMRLFAPIATSRGQLSMGGIE